MLCLQLIREDKEQGKFEELKEDANVNLSSVMLIIENLLRTDRNSFYDPKTTAWASIAAKARISTDRSRIKDLYSPQISVCPSNSFR